MWTACGTYWHGTNKALSTFGPADHKCAAPLHRDSRRSYPRLRAPALPKEFEPRESRPAIRALLTALPLRSATRAPLIRLLSCSYLKVQGAVILLFWMTAP